MSIYNEIKNRIKNISIIGLGYVGMPIAVSFAKKEYNVIGYDINKEKIELYNKGIDPTFEVGDEAIKNTTVQFTSNEEDLKNADFHIIAVPTPINQDKTPNLTPLKGASETVGKHLNKGAYVVYESTVYPGLTEDYCIPILEKFSGLKCGEDFKVGYSPERINPGDKVNRLESIVKIVSGSDEEALEEIAKVYELIIDAGVHRASSIKVAEAAKVVENSQRDINIAFMNELALVFDKMDIDTKEVVSAMNTKWNALGFTPGLVGGHCIGVDPYYFIYEAEKLGYHSQIVLSGRKINDGMADFVAESVIKLLIKTNKKVKESKIAILGLTFKENTPDTRNSKIFDMIKKLKEYNIEPILVDPVADKTELKEFYKVEVKNLDSLKNLDCIILAVPHDEFKNIDLNTFDKMYNQELPVEERIFVDIKGLHPLEDLKSSRYTYWRL